MRMRGCAIRLSIFLHHLAGTIHAAVVVIVSGGGGLPRSLPRLVYTHTLRADIPPSLRAGRGGIPLLPNELFALRQIAERCISLVQKSRNKCDLNQEGGNLPSRPTVIGTLGSHEFIRSLSVNPGIPRGILVWVHQFFPN